MEDFLFGFVADGAGVVEDEVGLLDGFYLTISLVDERADDFFGVMDVHLAAEGFEVESLVWIPSHRTQYKRCLYEMLVWVGHSCPTLLGLGLVGTTPPSRSGGLHRELCTLVHSFSTEFRVWTRWIHLLFALSLE